MASNVFVSFDHDDQRQVGGFKLLKNNPSQTYLKFKDRASACPEMHLNFALQPKGNETYGGSRETGNAVEIQS